MAFIEFNANDVPEFDLLPNGDYLMMVTDSDIIENKSGTGSHIDFRMVVVEGERKNFVLHHRLTWTNPSQDAVSIGRKRLAELCRAVGVMSPTDTSDLHNLTFVARVSVKKDRNDPNLLYNNIEKIMPSKGFSAPHSASSQPSGDLPPWK